MNSFDIKIGRYAACVEYDGAFFSGWQCQAGSDTVQQRIQDAISNVADHPVTIVGSGRTDAGVHAIGQVFHFDSNALRDNYAWLRGTNTHLPDEIALQWVQAVDQDFHARFRAIRRCYRYVIYNRKVRPTYLTGKVTWEYRQLNAGLMQQAAELLIGEHDFSSFRASGCQSKSPVRLVESISVADSGEWIWFDICANAFLQHMVRNIAGVLIAVGCGERTVDWTSALLESRDRTKGGVTAPPDGLYLTRVEYPSCYNLPVTTRNCHFW